MNRSDRLVAVVVAATLLVGGVLTWRATPQSGMMGSGMHSPMGGTAGPAPVAYAFGTVLLAALVVVGYLLVRDEQSNGGTERTASAAASDTSASAAQAANGGSSPEAQATTASESGGDPDPTETAADPDSGNDEAGVAAANDDPPTAAPADRVLDLLPEDERRVLGPVVDSPGLTQIELRDRAEFSKSKVSQTVSDLEQRGLLYREPQGRTYRVYPSEDLTDGDAPES
ncbi:MarR family transcriptional regulator [Halapricum sp. CBA1109]|uniref:helix-turn-helix transcriptional regulator n=1 Tax=Halapricum sp. CBA1109 TaxID=2668068 RepID=UPI0012F9D1DD|nr:helix-turn-helix domain-containing protein [Halapricum sp. CBA1109]MUV91026.1 MarR family transcriptional regulator [Halapricum sp. CBA1109]